MDFMDSERSGLNAIGIVVVAGPSSRSILGDYTEGGVDAPLVDGVFSGKGTETLTKDGKTYTLECTWENGKKNGEGILLNEDSILVMKLHFVDDNVDGEGCIYENGHILFKGVWKNGVRCGFGQEFSGGKVLFKGMYADDVRNGYGVSYSASGDPVFEGEWVNGLPGKKEIVEDELGNRVLVEKDVEDHVIYKGGFKEGTVLRDGIGTVFDSSGACVKTSVYSEDMEERCVRSFANGAMSQFDASGHKIYEGSYVMTPRGPVAQGEGRQFSPAGVPLYQGEFQQGRRCGFGRSFVNRTLQYEGMWADDQANGRGKLYDSAGMLLVEGEFQNDVCSTENASYHREHGKLASRGTGCFCRRTRPSLPPVSRGECCVKTASDLALAGQMRHVTVSDAVWGGMDTLGVADGSAVEELVFQGDETPASPNQFATLQKQKRLLVSQCNALREIRFLRNACAEVVRLRIEEVPSLRSLAIGPVGETPMGFSFCWAESLHLENLPALETLQIGDGSFRNVKSYESDMPALQTLILGEDACMGQLDVMGVGDRIVELRGLDALVRVVLGRNAWKNMEVLRLAGVGQLTAEGVDLDEGALSQLSELKCNADVRQEVKEKIQEGKTVKLFLLKKCLVCCYCNHHEEHKNGVSVD